MTTGRILTGIVIALIFVLLARKYWGKAIGAGPTILNIGAVVVILFAGYNYAVDQAAAKATERANQIATETYYTCITKVDRSAGNRAYNLKVQEVFSKAFGPSANPYLAVLRAELDNDLPALKYRDCPPAPGMTVSDIPEGP